MNLTDKIGLTLASTYLRTSPVPLGRWRFIQWYLPLLRQQGHTLGERTVHTHHGFLYKADLGDWLGQYVYLTGEYEPPTARVIKNLLKPGDSFIDIGANSGFFTLLAAKKVGPAGKVLGFEPVPSMRQRLLDNLDLNGFAHVQIHPIALSDHKGSLPLHEGPVGHKGTSSLREISESEATIIVETMPLDELPDLPATINGVKIDVEGAEQLVINGMENVIDTHHPWIVIEMTEQYLQAFDHHAIDLAKSLTNKKNYKMFKIAESGLIPMAPEQAADDDQYNALFTSGPVPANLIASAPKP